MLQRTLSYLVKHPLRVMKMVARDPREAWIKFEDRYFERRERRAGVVKYQARADWEQRLHELLGVPWPCEATSQFRQLWSQLVDPLEATGVRVGPEAFGSWNDGDAALVRAVWCLVHHLKPLSVVETGVAHGFTSRFILEALEHNGDGRLFSIDLPPIDPVLRAQVGSAVGDKLRERWTYIEGSSRLRLPKLLAGLRQLDLFIHDSLHSERNVRFEMDRVWSCLRPGGFIVVDDIDANNGFQSFSAAFPDNESLVCEAEPIHPDLRRFNQKGLFGIVFKPPATR
jgi:hypothetical protein